MEAECIKDAGKLTGKIISCGGGIIKREENFYSLKQNGKIILIKRDIKNLATEGRPLSSSLDALLEMEKERMPLYDAFKDITIENSGDLNEFKNKLIAEF